MIETPEKNALETGQRLVQFYKQRAENPSRIWGIPWGIPSLDAATGGIQYQPRNELTTLISRSNVGKTSWAVGVTRNVSTYLWEMQHSKDAQAERWQDKRVKCILLEGGRDAFQDRMAMIQSGVPRHKLQSGRVTKEEMQRYVAAQNEIYRLPIDYLDTDDREVNLETIDAFLRQDDTAWWMLDHIGLIPGALDGVAELNRIANHLLRLCKATAPGMVLTHQSRSKNQLEKGESDFRPSQENTAGSDQIVRNADLLLGLYREDMHKKQTDEERNEPVKPGELIIIKQRNGPTGTIHMLYHTRRTEWAEDKKLNSFWLRMLEE